MTRTFCILFAGAVILAGFMGLSGCARQRAVPQNSAPERLMRVPGTEASGLSAGVEPPAPSKKPPPAGKVRIVAQKLLANDNIARWKWTIIGDRKWSRASGSLTSLKLSQSHPLKDKSASSGSNVWECYLNVRAIRAGGMIAKMALREDVSLQSESAAAFNVTGIDYGVVDVPPPQSVKLHGMETMLMKLPAKVPLATIEVENTIGKNLSKTIILHISK